MHIKIASSRVEFKIISIVRNEFYDHRGFNFLNLSYLSGYTIISIKIQTIFNMRCLKN